MEPNVTYVVDGGQEMVGEERYYDVVRNGNVKLTVLMRDYDAVNYAKAMGFVLIPPGAEQE